MVRSELIEMGVINSSVPPMMIADAVGDKLKESAEALRKENAALRAQVADLKASGKAIIASEMNRTAEAIALRDQVADLERKQGLLINAIHEIGISAGVLNSDVQINGAQALQFTNDIQESLMALKGVKS